MKKLPQKHAGLELTHNKAKRSKLITANAKEKVWENHSAYNV